MEERYKNNIGSIITEELQEKFKTMKMAVLGCGGQGGYVAEFLTRLGIGTIILYDGDNFEESNLNRQLGATEKTIGKNKANIVAKRCKEINSNINIIFNDKYFGSNIENDYNLLKDCNFIFDEMDYSNLKNSARIVLKKLLFKCPITNSWNDFFCSSMSIMTSKDIDKFDNITNNINISNNMTNEQPACLCAATASLEILYMIKYFLNQYDNKIYLYNYWFNCVDIKNKIF